MKFFLIDGSWFLYRAYYALPPLRDSTGQNMNVIYGFFRMLLKIFQEKPDYLVITRDSPVKTIRHEAYPEYKANRKKMEDDFKHQIPITQKIVQELGIPNISAPGYEADDIIATFVHKYKENPDLMIDIYSSDKDLKQLLAPNVFAVDPMKGITIKTEDFVREFNFNPENILDYLSLVGDSSDNIKWVAGIWPKKASDLIVKYQTIDNIYAHIDEITGDVKQRLLDDKESAYQSRDLITLHTVKEVESTTIENFTLKMDFPHFKNVLVNQNNFHSIQKTLDELQKRFETPQQQSLW